MLISCVAEIMFRTTTVLHFALSGPQYFAFGVRRICDVVLYCFSTYGPLPAPTEAGELSHCSALSVLSASAASVPPCALTSFELTIPSDVFARISGSAVFGTFDFRTTPYLPFAATLTSASRNDGLPFRLIRRLNEKTTSAEVSGVPSAKWTFFFSLNVNVFASFDAVYDSASCGTGCATSAPLYVSSVSKTARLTMLAVGSNARCGSAVLISNDRSITSVPPADERAVAPCAATATAIATTGISASRAERSL